MEEYNLTIILCCHVIPPEEKIALYQKKCRQLILFCADSAESISSDILVVPWQPEDGKVAALKKAIEQATSTHILWLEANENLPPIPELQAKTFYPASILNVKSESRALNWQIRLFPNFNFDHLSGFEIPELFPVLNKAGICRADESLAIEKGGALFPLKRIKKEVNNEAG
ncbi:MAG TPA: hypothetical protein VE868_02545, partial [Balneolaceae bacterium]|nr:hypothetical protein [Balneolaceae bacterium]